MERLTQAILIASLPVLLFLIRKNARLNLILLAFSIPFESYINWKVGFTFKPAQLFALTAFISLILNREKVTVPLKFHIPFFLILLAASVSLINAPAALIFKSYQGSLRMILNFGFLYFIAFTVSIAIKDADSLKNVIFAYAAGAFFSILVELARTYLGGWGREEALFSWLPFGHYIRLTPIDMAPNQYAAVLMIALVLITTLGIYRQIRLRPVFKYLLPVFFVTCLYGFILTFSRGPWLDYLITLPIILMLSKKKGLYRAALYGGACLAAAALLLLCLYPKTLKPLYVRSAVTPVYNAFHDAHNENALRSADEGSAVDRIIRWKHAVQMIKLHPVIGNGWASDLIPHNVVLQILSESGVLGLSAFSIFAFFIYYNLYRSVKMLEGEMKFISVGIIAGLAGYMMYLMTDIGLYQIQTWFLMGLGMAVIRMAIICPEDNRYYESVHLLARHRRAGLQKAV